MQITKADQVRELLRQEKWTEAFRICSRFQDLGEHRDDIKRGHECITNARFYRQLGKDVDALIEQGKVAMISRYKP